MPRTGSKARFVDTQEIALVRHDPDVGRVAVHFPRLGYDWRRA
jgi:glutathione S-transferase